MENLKSRIFAFIFICIATICKAEDFSFSVGLKSGIKAGQLNEFVFYKNDSVYQKLSELNWSLEPSFFAGLALTGEYKAFLGTLSFTGFIPCSSGKTKDSDWQSISNPDIKTNYSISKNFLESAGSIYSSAEYRFFKDFVISLGICSALSFDCFSLKAKDGYGWYGDAANSKNAEDVSYTDPAAKYYDVGELSSISYSFKSYGTWIGISPKINFSPKSSVSIFYYISPFSFFQSIDHHYATAGNGTYYLDFAPSFFNGQKIGLSLCVNPTPKFTISADAIFSFYNEFKSKDYSSSDETKSFSQIGTSAKSGFSNHFIEGSFCILYKPFEK